MATQYSHPFEDITTTEELANAFQTKFQLGAENHGETITVPLKQNWDANAVIDLVEATPFIVLCYDDDEATITQE